jgi:putative phosphonate metabolism protein
MENMNRFAVYYVPEVDSPFAHAAAAWLGWDLQTGRAVAHPTYEDLPHPLADLTKEPRKYGFHGTIKAPFRLIDGASVDDLSDQLNRVAMRHAVVVMPGLQMISLHGFLAFIPSGEGPELNALAASVVGEMDPFRAPLTQAEIAKRRPDTLTLRQQELLETYGYPFVMEEFQFHLTLSGRLPDAQMAAVARAAAHQFMGVVPQPFRIAELCLCAETEAGQFQLVHRFPLRA